VIAKAAGVLAGALIMALWFWATGTVPVLQTVVGLLLGLAAGLWVWVAIDRWLSPRDASRRGAAR
jgi:hypothetical protein